MKEHDKTSLEKSSLTATRESHPASLEHFF
jgi:hypothetical protein